MAIKNGQSRETGHYYMQTNTNNLQTTGGRRFYADFVTDIITWNSEHNRTTQKTKKMSNMDPTKYLQEDANGKPVNPGCFQTYAN